MEHAKRYANRGVERNKKPLQNKPTFVLLWAYEREYNRHPSKSFHGPVTLDQIKARLTPSQWSKFRQGTREFVKQRRVDGRNVPKSTPKGSPVHGTHE